MFRTVLIIFFFINVSIGRSYAIYSEFNSSSDLLNNIIDNDQITISGVVKDKESGETLPFANVYVKDTNIGTTTNEDGFFTLFNVPSENSTIQVQYLGYKIETIILTAEIVKEKIIIQLVPDDNQLDEVVLLTIPGKLSK